MNTLIYIVIGLGCAIVGFFIGIWVTYRNNVRKITYMMDSIEDGEMNFRFAENSKINSSLNRLRIILEKFRQENEAESWSKLIRVLTHEIMNTVTPISALSESLANDPNLDTKAGLETIASSSKDLINFINSYRSLSKIAKPVKRPIMVAEMVCKVIDLTEKYIEELGAKCYFREISSDVLLYADEGQISQILINLIKNAAQAESSIIEVTSEINSKEEVVIKVIDNGQPISHESKEQIFIPFYTTKSGGSGIGLSLSRQIMRLHNGTLELEQSDYGQTVFTLTFN
ncbi:MAG: HAMP domain-containing histidine kinase [Bacteroidales bacterium]|nr:HAMP domain-containing histidine kinase [Bacteroidales bacterium]